MTSDTSLRLPKWSKTTISRGAFISIYMLGAVETVLRRQRRSRPCLVGSTSIVEVPHRPESDKTIESLGGSRAEMRSAKFSSYGVQPGVR